MRYKCTTCLKKDKQLPFEGIQTNHHYQKEGAHKQILIHREKNLIHRAYNKEADGKEGNPKFKCQKLRNNKS